MRGQALNGKTIARAELTTIKSKIRTRRFSGVTHGGTLGTSSPSKSACTRRREAFAPRQSNEEARDQVLKVRSQRPFGTEKRFLKIEQKVETFA